MNRPLLVDKPLICGFLLSAFIAVIMSLPSLQFERFEWWPKVVDPALIALGFLGSAYRSKPLRIVGWAGILLFSLHAFAMIAPGEDYLSGGSDGPGPMTPRSIGLEEIGLRLVVVAGLVAALVVCFRKVKQHRNSGLIEGD